MRVRAGTSGFSYKSWKGAFYPADLPQRAWLSYYSSRLPAVEINNTFYRLPKAETLLQWAEAVAAAPEFSFVIKASRRITHMRRLRQVEDPLAYLLSSVERLEQRLGALLFQLPPDLALDLELLREFVALLPRGIRAAFEFRHPSWLSPAVYDCLHERDCALCLTDELVAKQQPAGAVTASWGYLRLRHAAYSDEQLARWRDWIAEQSWKEAFVFFKHEDTADGALLAEQFNALCAAERPQPDHQQQ